MGLHFERLAMEWGDGIMNRQKVRGKIRCAEVEYGSDTWEFVTEKLQVRAVPTLQLYSGLHKLWELSGKTSTRALKEELLKLQSLDEGQLQAHAVSVDDGVLEEVIEESFFDNF